MWSTFGVDAQKKKKGCIYVAQLIQVQSHSISGAHIILRIYINVNVIVAFLRCGVAQLIWLFTKSQNCGKSMANNRARACWCGVLCIYKRVLPHQWAILLASPRLASLCAAARMHYFSRTLFVNFCFLSSAHIVEWRVTHTAALLSVPYIYIYCFIIYTQNLTWTFLYWREEDYIYITIKI